MPLGVVDDHAGGPPVSEFRIGNWVVVSCKDYLSVMYEYATTTVTMVQVAKADSVPLLPPEDNVSAVYFVRRANVETCTPTPEGERELTSEEQAWKELGERGFKHLMDTQPDSLIVAIQHAHNNKRARPVISAMVMPYFMLNLALHGGGNYTSPGVTFQLVDTVGLRVTPAIVTSPPPGTTVYDGMAGALGFGVEKTDNVIKAPNSPEDDPVLIFGVIIRAFNPNAKVDTGYYFTRRTTFYYDKWVVKIGPDRDLGIVYPEPPRE